MKASGAFLSTVGIFAVGTVALLAASKGRAQDIFQFETSQVKMLAASSIPSTGIVLTADNDPARTATFTPSGPDMYQFDSNGTPPAFAFGFNLSGNIIGNTGPDRTAADVLTVTFSQPIVTFSLDYVLYGAEDNGAGTLNLGAPAAILPTAFGTSTGSLNSLGNYQGIVGVESAIPFYTVTISSSIPDYFIDNLTVAPVASSVPEPGLVAFALACALPLGWSLRRCAVRK